MAYKFKKQIFGFMDLLRFKKMVPIRREKLANGDDKKLPVSYRVNETAKILHPGFQKGKLIEIRPIQKLMCFRQSARFISAPDNI